MKCERSEDIGVYIYPVIELRVDCSGYLRRVGVTMSKNQNDVYLKEDI